MSEVLKLARKGRSSLFLALPVLLVALLSVGDAAATPPPGQNGRVIFSLSVGDSLQDVYALNADGSVAGLTSTRAAAEYWPEPSPDGMRISYAQITTQPNGLPLDNLFVMRADGTQQKQLTFYNDPNEQAHSPTWTSDGSAILFVHATANGNDIWSVKPDGTNLHRRFGLDWAVQGIDVSPDGTKLAYSVYVPGISGYAIFVHDLDGSTPDVQLTGSFQVDDLHPRWSPDGTRIVFDNQFEGVTVINADGSNRTSLASVGSLPYWSPDGSKIIMQGTGFNDWSQLLAMNPDGSDLHQLTAIASANAAFPTWSRRPQAATQIDALLSYTLALPPGGSLTQKVRNAQSAFADGAGNWDNTCNKLNAVSNEANSEAGITITAAQAASVAAQTSSTRTLMQC